MMTENRYGESIAGFDAESIVEQIMKEQGNRTIAEYLECTDDWADGFPNVSVEEMDLSVRSYNCIKRARISDLKAILQCTASSILKIHSLGKKTMVEILQKVYATLCDNPSIIPSANAGQSSNETGRFEELLNCKHLRFLNDAMQKYGFDLEEATRKRLLVSMFNLWCDTEATPEEIAAFENAFLNSEQYDRMLQKQILHRIKENGYGLTEEALAQTFAEGVRDHVRDLLEQMQENGMLRCIKGRFVPTCKTLQEWLEENPEDRGHSCLKRRLQGATLQEIAEEMGLTRERVRQICIKALEKLKNAHIALFEDCYVPLYEKYSISADEIRVIFSESAITAGYLKIFYKEGSLPLEAAVEDETLPQDMRRRIAEYLEETDNTITLDGEKHPLEQRVLMEYMLEKYCTDITDVDEYIRLYNAFLQGQDIDRADLRIHEKTDGIGKCVCPIHASCCGD